MSAPIKCFFLEFARYVPVENGERAIWKRADTGEEMFLPDAPAGAMWYADWFDNHWNPQLGPGKVLIVKTPGGDWIVDSQANNCTMPDDANQDEHHCWVLHGTPPNITVDKDGVTCKAGAGSIGQKTWHGFLERGYLVLNRHEAP